MTCVVRRLMRAMNDVPALSWKNTPLAEAAGDRLSSRYDGF